MSRPRSQEAPRLFAADELELRRTGQARFRAMARKPPLPLSEIERRKDEDREAMDKLRGWGVELAGRFKLRWKCLIAEREGVVDHYGICYEDGEIRIRLRHATTGRLLKESSLVDTLCHEIAHLRFLDHSERFRKLYIRILNDARGRGWYRPGPQDDRRPTQLALFGDGCGTTRMGNKKGGRQGNGRARPV